MIQIFDSQYMIDEDGNIFNSRTNRFLKGSQDKNGYRKVCLWINDKRTNFFVHRLLMTHFKPVKEMEKLVVNHIDGNKTNNNLNNLEWTTIKENNKHAQENDLLAKQKGEKNGQAKLSENDIIFIRESNLTGVQLSKMFNISQSQISKIKNKTQWQHI